MSRLIYNTISKKLADFKEVHQYTSSDQAAYDKIIGLLTNSSHYTWKIIKMYFQATMLINIRTKYSALVSAIQKNRKDETINLTESVLEIIKHFEFIKESKKSNKVIFQSSTLGLSARSKPSPTIFKRLCRN